MTAGTSLWGGRFASGPSAELTRLSRSPERYYTLAPYDVIGSKAHAHELQRAGLLDAEETKQITAALQQISDDYLNNQLVPIESDEDVHTFLERVLIERLGPLGGKLRAGRSRNDQAANDLRLYLRDNANVIVGQLLDLVEALKERAVEFVASPVPGFTHLQSAQPVTFGHQLLAHAQPLIRDVQRFEDWSGRAAVSPLGSAALAGSTFAVTPEVSAAEQGYTAAFENSIDAVSSRDIALEFLFISSMVMVDISRLCEEITLWASRQFSWITLDDGYSTGSSIMPQKKNPDIAEISRGYAGRVIGELTGVLAAVKSLPLAYNRDLAMDKAASLDVVEVFSLVLPALTGLIRTFRAHEQTMAADAIQGFTLATEAADWIAKQGVPFNRAHDIAGAMVRYAEAREIGLEDLEAADLEAIDPLLKPELLERLSVDAALEAHSGPGGTAPAQVKRQIERLTRAIRTHRDRQAAYSGPRIAKRALAAPISQPSTTGIPKEAR